MTKLWNTTLVQSSFIPKADKAPLAFSVYRAITVKYSRTLFIDGENGPIFRSELY